MPFPFRMTYVGHSTAVIELDGIRILTDPLLRGRVGFLRRAHPPAEPPAERGAFDAILISHAHADHLDPGSLRRIDPSTHVVVPPGAARIVRRAGLRTVEELEIGASTRIGSLDIGATPALHSGFRPPFGPRSTSIGFLLTGSRRLYFAGDTDLFPGMGALADELDVALLPIWGWGPTLGHGHLDPLRAAQALTLLRPRLAVPIHWGTLRPIGLRPRPRNASDPAAAFLRHAAELAPEVEVRVVPVGTSTDLAS